jgi:dTDP-glucose 4,6-dehydratase
VDDLVDGVYRLLHSGFDEPVNIGTQDEMSVLRFAHFVNELTGNEAGIIFKDERIKGDPQTRRPDTTRAETILGWSPRVSLSEGLPKTINYFRELM